MERDINQGVASKNLRDRDFECSREEWFQRLSESKSEHLKTLKQEPGPDFIGVGSLTRVRNQELKNIRPNGRTAEIVLFEVDTDE
jgi:hypothetical protein